MRNLTTRRRKYRKDKKNKGIVSNIFTALFSLGTIGILVVLTLLWDCHGLTPSQ